MESKKIKFTVQVDSREALERAIYYVNLQSSADYELIHYEEHEVGLATIEVSEDKIKLEFLFMMGHRYSIYFKPKKLNF